MPAGLDGNSEPIVTEARSAVIARIAELVLAQKQNEIPLLIAVDGIDGAGKSTFADELLAALTTVTAGRAIVVRASIDSFHNPREVRYRKGRGSGDGFYLDSHNLPELQSRLLTPFRSGAGTDYRTACFDEPTDEAVEPASRTLTGDEILLFDGIFLCRPELVDHWDYIIHLDGRTRVDQNRSDRYTGGMTRYFDSDHPIDRADLVIDNSDLSSPLVTIDRGVRDVIQRTAWRQRFIDLLAAERRTDLLEIGSGPGRDTLTLRDAGLSVVGLDLSIEAMKLLGAEGAPAVNGSVYELPVRDASFDAAWTMSTLMHIPDARFDEALAEICRALKPGAPIGIGLWGGMDREGISDFDTIVPPRFFSFRSHERTKKMLAAHGRIELFETKDYNSSNGEIYQFAILRPG